MTNKDKGRAKSILTELAESVSKESAILLSIYVKEPSIESLSKGFELIKKDALDAVKEACS